MWSYGACLDLARAEFSILWGQQGEEGGELTWNLAFDVVSLPLLQAVLKHVSKPFDRATKSVLRNRSTLFPTHPTKGSIPFIPRQDRKQTGQSQEMGR